MTCRLDALAPRAPSPPRIPIPSRAAALPHHSSTSRLLPTRHHSLRSPPAPPFPPERRNSQGPHRRSINRGSGAVPFRKQRIANETSSRGRGSSCPRSAIRLLPQPDFSPPHPAVPPLPGPTEARHRRRVGRPRLRRMRLRVCAPAANPLSSCSFDNGRSRRPSRRP